MWTAPGLWNLKPRTFGTTTASEPNVHERLLIHHARWGGAFQQEIVMSLRINSNIAALNGQINLSRNTDMVNQSLERLSSGLQINSAADDPAGLIISEQMRAQIGGLNQAISNSQQAVTMIQTAEGAMDEVSTLLNKARSLAVHAANAGVNDTNQLVADQTELDNIVDSVNRIANNTQFGTKKILDGSLSNGSPNSSAIASVKLGGDYTSLVSKGSVTRGYHTLQITQSASQSSYQLLQSHAADIWSGGSLSAARGSDLVKKGFQITINGAAIAVASGTTKSQFIQQLNAVGKQIGFTAATTGSASGAVNLKARDFGTSFVFDVQFVSGATGSATMTGVSKTGTNAKAVLYLYSGANGINGTAGSGAVQKINFSGNGLNLVSSGGSTIVLNGPVGISTGASSGFIYGAINGTSAGATFHIGADYGQTATVELNSVQATQLGVGGSSAFSSFQQLKGTALVAGNAEDAIRVIDKAIDDVTTSRGELGAFQANTLETSINSMQVTQQNLTSADSTIRDVDFAAESANFTKYNILVQSSTAMLAQANQLPQGVLKLLQ
jgi:flagellin